MSIHGDLLNKISIRFWSKIELKTRNEPIRLSHPHFRFASWVLMALLRWDARVPISIILYLMQVWDWNCCVPVVQLHNIQIYCSFSLRMTKWWPWHWSGSRGLLSLILVLTEVPLVALVSALLIKQGCESKSTR